MDIEIIDRHVEKAKGLFVSLNFLLLTRSIFLNPSLKYHLFVHNYLAMKE